MTDAQVAELEEALVASLKSTTIEWGLNMRICDLVQANPSLCPCALHKIRSRLWKENPVAALLALSLLEMIVKNCGLAACRFVDAELTEALVAIVKKRECWRYGLGRNLHKSGFSAWLPAGSGIGEDDRKLWQQASQKVLEMLQLWVDAFMLQEGELCTVFNAYKMLRMEGYKFPRGQHGASEGLCLVHGAEDSPALLAGAAASGGDAAAHAEGEDLPAFESDVISQAHAKAAVGMGSTGADRSLAVPADAATDIASSIDTIPEEIAATRALLEQASGSALDPAARARLSSAQAWATGHVETHMEDGHLDEEILDALLALIEDLNSALAKTSVDCAAEPLAVEQVPPPPSEAPPEQKQQEMYDMMLAQFLQQRENESFLADSREDAALALRLSMEERNQGLATDTRQPSTSSLARCGRCGSVNQLQRQQGFGRSGGPTFFVCYSCSQTQAVPRESIVPQCAPLSSGPLRHAPTARVIQAAGAGPELLISAGGSEASFGGGSSQGAASSASAASYAPNASQDSMPTAQVLGESLLGAASGAKSSAKRWAESMRSWVPDVSSSSAADSVKRLGDGTPDGEYTELGGEEAVAPLCGGPPREPVGGWGSLSLPKGGRSEIEESLLDRVQVDGDWELIRPSGGGRPYWYNSSSHVSQWEPPEVVRRGSAWG